MAMRRAARRFETLAYSNTTRLIDTDTLALLPGVNLVVRCQQDDHPDQRTKQKRNQKIPKKSESLIPSKHADNPAGGDPCRDKPGVQKYQGHWLLPSFETGVEFRFTVVLATSQSSGFLYLATALKALPS